MRNKKLKPGKPAKDYPKRTHGSEVAARGRRKANKMTDAQREEYFRRGMVLIHGGQIAETTVAGHETFCLIWLTSRISPMTFAKPSSEKVVPLSSLAEAVSICS